MASIVYNSAKRDLLNGVIDLDGSNTLKVLLVKDTYTPDPDHATVADLKSPTDYELSGTGYTGGPGGSGRKTMAQGDRSVTADNTNDRAVFDIADDPVWTGIDAGVAGGIVLYQHNSGSDDSLNKLILFGDFADQPTSGGSLTVAWNSAGVIHATG